MDNTFSNPVPGEVAGQANQTTIKHPVMNMPNRLWNPAILTVLLGLVLVPTTFSLDPGVPDPYVPHPPIIVEGEEDLTPENGVTGGSGTEDDPFMITGWAILSPPSPLENGAIRISNVTDVHLTIERNLLTAIPGDGGCAIFLQNVALVKIRDNEFSQTWAGVCALDSRELTVSDNSLVSTHSDVVWLTGNSIVLLNTQDSEITDNTISGFLAGMTLENGSNGNLIAGNLLEGNGAAGSIKIEGESQYNLVYNNTIRNSFPGTGIQISSNNNQVIGNVLQNLGHGVSVGGLNDPATNITIQGNDFMSLFRAVRLTCTECEFSFNTIRDAEETSDGQGGHGLLWSRNVVTHSGRLFLNEFHARNNSFPHEESFHIVTQERTDLRYNWWGDPSGPRDGAITGTDLITPWLTQPPESLPKSSESS